MDAAAKVKRTSALQMFASFRLGEFEIAISIASLQEVVVFPDKVTQIPLSPDYLTGLFNLRGVITPIVDVSKILGFESAGDKANKKVAIIAAGPVKIGLLFDSTSEILNIPENEIGVYDPVEGKKNIITSVLRLNGGDRLIEVLDPLKLVQVENMPDILAKAKGNVVELAKKNSKRAQCITFRTGIMEFGLNISGIREIIKVPEIKRSVLAVDYCIGMVNLRGTIVPIIDFKQFLKIQATESSEVEARRIIVLKLGQVQVGLLVDSVDSIVSFFADEILPIPLFQQEKMEMMKGLLPEQQNGNVVLLDEQKILSDNEIMDINKGHLALYGKNNNQEAEKAKKAERRAYLSFRLNHMLSTKLNAIDEIAKVGEDLVHPPGYPEYVVGMMNMRGEMVMVIDLRSYYGLKPAEGEVESRVLVVRGSKAKYGLLVDAVESIDTVDESQKIKIPSFLAKDVISNLQGDMKDVVEMTDVTGNKKTYMILEIAALVEKLEACTQ
jgi:Chemotaxis signal transduction protein